MFSKVCHKSDGISFLWHCNIKEKRNKSFWSGVYTWDFYQRNTATTADKDSIHKFVTFFLKVVNNEWKLIHYSWLPRKCPVFQPLIARKMPAHAYLLAYCGRCTRAWRNGLWFVCRFPGSDLAPPPPGNGAFKHIAENVLVWRGTKALDKLVSNGLTHPGQNLTGL